MTFLTDDKLIAKIEQALEDRSEAHDIEFKDGRGGLNKDIWRSITSFSLLPGGGYIVFGVRDDRPTNVIEVVGGLNIHDLQEAISNYYRDVMARVGTPEMSVLTIRGERLVVLKVPELSADKRPPYYKPKGLPAGCCIRDGITDRGITYEEMANLIRNSSINFKFDQTRADGTTIEALDSAKIADFLARSARRRKRTSADNTPSLPVLINTGIALEYANEIAPSVAGYLIFSREHPQLKNQFSRYIIRCVRYQGNDASTPIIDKQDLEGTLDEQINGMLAFTLRNIARRAKIVGTKRVESYAYPEEALREILANAVIHRDYTITETFTQVNIFANRIEITNPGNLAPGVSVENIKDTQFSRNEFIADILRDLDYLEEYGRGIDIAIATMLDSGLLPPLFKNSINSFRVTLLGEQFKDLNDRQVQIWHQLQEVSQLSARQMLDMFENVSRPTINNDIRKLIDTGLIRSRGNGSNTYYEARY